MCKKEKYHPNEEADTEESFTVIDLESDVLYIEEDGRIDLIQNTRGSLTHEMLRLT